MVFTRHRTYPLGATGLIPARRHPVRAATLGATWLNGSNYEMSELTGFPRR